MNKTSLFQQAVGGIFFLFLCTVFMAGCEVQKRSCPPLAGADEAKVILNEYYANLKPLKATGNCTLNYTNEKGEKFAQSFPVRIWYQSNSKFCFYGDVMFDPKGVCFTVSGDKYWSYAKPLKMFTKGDINEETDDYFANPLIIIDFLNPAGAGCENLTLAKSEKDFNILVCKDGCRRKKIFIDRCGYFVKKIEYSDCLPNTGLVIETDEYKKVTGANFLFPRKLIYKDIEKRNGRNIMRIKLDSVKLWQPNPEQLNALFTEPDADTIQKEIK